MTAFAAAFAVAGLVSEADAKKASREAESRLALRALCHSVQDALRRGDVKAYVRLRGKLPRDLRSKY